MPTLSISRESVPGYFDFFLPYDIGYAVFLTTTIVGALGFAAFWGMYTKRHDTWLSQELPTHLCWGRHVSNTLLMLSLEIAVALLAWSATNFPMNYFVHDSPPRIGMIGIMFATIFLWFPLVFLTDFLGRRKDWLGVIIFLTAIFLFLPGSTMLAVYCKQMGNLQTFEYFGPMMVTNFAVNTYEHTGVMRRRNYSMHFGKPQVGWGFEWGCPSQPDKWCTAETIDQECHFCEGRSIYGCYNAGTAENVAQCMIQKYQFGEPDAGTIPLTGLHDGEFIPLPPLNQNEPTEYSLERHWFFGDCRTCRAMEKKSWVVLASHYRTIRDIGAALLLLCIGVCLTTLTWQLARNSFLLKRYWENNDANNQTNNHIAGGGIRDEEVEFDVDLGNTNENNVSVDNTAPGTEVISQSTADGIEDQQVPC